MLKKLMMNKLLKFAFTVTTIFFGYIEAFGQCTCAYVTPDSQYVEAVFTGRVLTISEADKSNKYSVQISEIFRGLDSQESVEVYDSFYNCSDRREQNKEYLFLVSTNKQNGRLEVVGCSYSSLNKYKQRQFIEILRWQKNSKDKGGLLVGKVTQTVDDLGISHKPEGVNEVLIETENGEKHTAVIEPDGFYRFDGLKDGNYKVFLNLPKNLITYGEANGWNSFGPSRPNVKISGDSGKIEDFSILTNGIIGGRVLDKNGMPVSSINVNLLRFEDGKYDDEDAAETDQDGNFIFKGLSPGDYRLRVGADDSYVDPDDKEAIYPSTFFPSTNNLNSAKTIKLRKVETIQNLEVIMLPMLRKRVVSGTVYMPDGRPAPDADVVVQIKRKDNGRILSSGWYVVTHTDSAGNFSLNAYDNTEYLVQVDIDKPTGEVTVEVLYSSECFVLPRKRQASSLKIKLKKGDSKCNEEKFGF